MCVRVVFGSPSTLPGFDAEARTISIPFGLAPRHVETLVRAILAELLVDQPDFGTICWCGAPVIIDPGALIPQQKRTEVVVRHGA